MIIHSDAEGSDHRDAEAVEVSLPAKLVGIESDRREEKAGHNENDRDCPVVGSLMPAGARVTGQSRGAQPFLKAGDFLRMNRQLCVYGLDSGLVDERAPLGFASAVGFGQGDNVVPNQIPMLVECC